MDTLFQEVQQAARRLWRSPAFTAATHYGIDPRDPIVFAMMAIVLQLVAVIACWLPARRAAALNPTTALRAE